MDRRGGQRRKVAACVRFAEPLAPHLLAVEDGREKTRPLLVGAVGDDHRPAHDQPEDVGRRWRLGANHLLVEDRLLHERGAATAVLAWPGDADVARIEEGALPEQAEVDDVLGSLGLRTGPVLGQPRTHLVAELQLRRGQAEVHGSGAYLTGAGPEGGLREGREAPCGRACRRWSAGCCPPAGSHAATWWATVASARAR